MGEIKKELGILGFELSMAIIKIIGKIPIIACVYLIARYSYLSIRELSGNNLDLSVNGRFVIEGLTPTIDVNKYLFFIFIASMFINVILFLALKLKSHTLNEYKKRVGQLEKKTIDEVDPDRGSSNLTETGRTNPEDLP